MTFHFIKRIFFFKVLNKQKTPKKIEFHLQKNALINYNLKLDISNDNIFQGLLFIHSQSSTILLKIAKVATGSLLELAHLGCTPADARAPLWDPKLIQWVLAYSCSDLVPAWGACSSLVLPQDSVPRVFSLLTSYGHAKLAAKPPFPTTNESYQ